MVRTILASTALVVMWIGVVHSKSHAQETKAIHISVTGSSDLATMNSEKGSASIRRNGTNLKLRSSGFGIDVIELRTDVSGLGVLEGDRITAVGSNSVRTPEQMMSVLRDGDLEESIELTIIRNGLEKSTSTTRKSWSELLTPRPPALPTAR